jgi:hypothetical protein
MKKGQLIKTFLMLVFAGFLTSNISAQNIEITPMYGFQYGGKLSSSLGEFKTESSANYGVNLEISHEKLPVNVTFYWLQQKTNGVYNAYLGNERRAFDMTNDYYQIGVTKNLKEGTNVIPFTLITIGAANFTPKGTNLSSELMFSATLGAGVKVYLSERIGLRFHAKMLLPFQWGGAGLWCGSGGCGIGAGASTSFVQGDVGGGLIIRL